MKTGKRKFSAAILMGLLCIGILSAQTAPNRTIEDFKNRITPVNILRMQSPDADIPCAIGNFGMIGDPKGRVPSFEIPRGSGRNYLSNLELWAGIQLPDGPMLVTTADGEHNGREPEWNSADFDSIQAIVAEKGAVSDLDNICRYDDIPVIPLPGHQPIGLEVSQKVYAWLNERYLLIEYQIRNLGIRGTLTDLYLGIKADFDIPDAENKDYNLNDLAAFDKAANLSYMCNAGEAAADGAILGGEFIGVSILNHPVKSHAAWDWNHEPDSDPQKYALLAAKTISPPTAQPMDYRVLQSVGPFTLKVDESVKLMVAVIAGKSEQKLFSNTDKAVKTYLKTDRQLALKTAGQQAQFEDAGAPTRFDLLQNYPNPLNPNTQIRYQLPVASSVSLSVFNVRGQCVRVLEARDISAGYHDLIWDGNDASGSRVASGIYFAILEARALDAADGMRSFSKTVKMLVTK